MMTAINFFFSSYKYKCADHLYAVSNDKLQKTFDSLLEIAWEFMDLIFWGKTPTANIKKYG